MKTKFTAKQLKEWFGLNENIGEYDLKEGYAWNTNLIVTSNGESGNDFGGIGYQIYLKELYAGEDLSKVDGEETDNAEVEAPMSNIQSKVTTTTKWIEQFVNNDSGFMNDRFMDVIGTLGDFFQLVANLPQTLEEKTASDSVVLYGYEFLSSDKAENKSKVNPGAGNRNKYTNVSEKEIKTRNKITIYVKKDRNENKEEDFTKETNIPVMVGDLYNIAVGHIDFFDTNFFTGKTSVGADGKTLRHAENSIWNNFTGVISTLIRICIYLASSIIMFSLIWYGIGIVRHTFDNPQARAESKEGINRLIKSVSVLSGSVFIMALCIFGTEAVFKMMKTENSYELPIRVNVEDTYSFSTTITGYLRYMSLTADLTQIVQRFLYTNAYLIMAFVNLAAIVMMFIRMVILWILSIIGPLLSIFYAFGKKGYMDFRKWAALYAGISFIQIFISLLYNVILGVVANI